MSNNENELEVEWERLLKSPENISRNFDSPEECFRALRDKQLQTSAMQIKNNNIGWYKQKQYEKQQLRNKKKVVEESDKQWKELRKQVPNYLAARKTAPEIVLPKTIGTENQDQGKKGDARLYELCSIDKAKITKVVQQLVKMDAEKKQLEEQSGQEKIKLCHRIDKLKNQNAAIVAECTELRTKFGHSLEMLKTYQEKLLSIQKNFDQQRALRMEADHSAASHMEKWMIHERQLELWKSDVEVKELQLKKEYGLQIKELESERQELQEKLRAEKRLRQQDKHVFAQQVQEHEQLKKYYKLKRKELKAENKEIPLRMKEVMDEWTHRLKDALQTSFVETKNILPQGKSPPPDTENETSIEYSRDINPIKHQTDLSPKKTIVSKAGQYISPYSQKRLNSPSNRRPHDIVASPKATFSSRTNFSSSNRKSTHSPKFRASQISNRGRVTKQGHHATSLNGPLSDSYREMSLFDIVSDLEHSHNTIAKDNLALELNQDNRLPKQYDMRHLAFRRPNSPRNAPVGPNPMNLSYEQSQGPLLATELDVRDAVENDLKAFIEEHKL